MQFLARFKAHRFAGGDADFGTGSGISADASFAGADAENAKSAQFDALSGGESLFQALEDRIHRRLCLGAGQARALDYMMDNVLLNQRGILVGTTGLTVLRLTGLMLQILMRLWNNENRSERLSPEEKPAAAVRAARPGSVRPKMRDAHCQWRVNLVK
jgi:hypothetical protein